MQATGTETRSVSGKLVGLFCTRLGAGPDMGAGLEAEGTGEGPVQLWIYLLELLYSGEESLAVGVCLGSEC